MLPGRVWRVGELGGWTELGGLRACRVLTDILKIAKKYMDSHMRMCTPAPEDVRRFPPQGHLQQYRRNTITMVLDPPTRHAMKVVKN